MKPGTHHTEEARAKMRTSWRPVSAAITARRQALEDLRIAQAKMKTELVRRQCGRPKAEVLPWPDGPERVDK